MRPSTFQAARDSGFNCIRLGIEYNRNWHADIDFGITDRLPMIDSAVNLAAPYGLYICIDYHECGSYNFSHLVDFWRQVAPRYKDRMHVLYELANEPVAWAPENYSNQNIADQKTVYDTIRKYAPNTMIILLSYATANNNMLSTTNKLTGIDWTNAAVGGHPYHVYDANGITSVKTKYPYISTEFANPGSGDWNIMCALQGDDWGWVKWHEANKTSWFMWNSSVGALLANARSRGYMWTPDNFANPVAIERSLRPVRGKAAILAAKITGRMFDIKGCPIPERQLSTAGIKVRIMQAHSSAIGQLVVIR